MTWSRQVSVENQRGSAVAAAAEMNRLVPLRGILVLQTLRRTTMVPNPNPGSMVQVRLQSDKPVQSDQPVPAGRIPRRVKLTGGKRYSWCACGHSNKQPFCDGAHKSKAPSIAPLRFTPDKDTTVLLCCCKQTRTPPYCDGTHFQVLFRDLSRSVRGMFK